MSAQHKSEAKVKPRKLRSKAKLQKQLKPPIDSQLVAIKEICSRLDSAKRANAVSKDGYFDVKTVLDTKKAEGDVKFLTDQLSAAKSSMKAMLGSRPFLTKIYGVGDALATVTTGVISTVIGVQVGVSAEFASFAALFDEYRVVGGRYHYSIMQIQNTSGTLAWHVVVFDPINSTALTSIYDGLSAATHKLAPLPVTGGGTGAALVPVAAHTLDFKIPPGSAIASALSAGGIWQPMTATTTNWGLIKHYSSPANPTIVTAVVAVSGVLEIHTEFRIRE